MKTESLLKNYFISQQIIYIFIFVLNFMILFFLFYNIFTLFPANNMLDKVHYVRWSLDCWETTYAPSAFIWELKFARLNSQNRFLLSNLWREPTVQSELYTEYYLLRHIIKKCLTKNKNFSQTAIGLVGEQVLLQQ